MITNDDYIKEIREHGVCSCERAVANNINRYIEMSTINQEIADIRKTRAHFGVFSVRLSEDKCMILVANNLKEVQEYIKRIIGPVEYKQLDTNMRYIKEDYRGLGCYEGRSVNFGFHLFICTMTKFKSTVEYVKGYLAEMKNNRKAN